MWLPWISGFKSLGLKEVLLHLLFSCENSQIPVDFISGIILAVTFKNSKKTENGKLSSSAGIIGLTRKIFILILVAVSTQLDIVLKTTFIRDGAVIGFISMEGISIIENATLAGLPIPRVIKNALEIINKKEKDKDE